MLQELSLLNNVHDVFLVLIDASFAFDLPTRVGGLDRGLRRRDRAHADDVARASWTARAIASAPGRTKWIARPRTHDLDVVRLSLDQVKFDVALIEWVAERRLRRRK